MHASAIIAKIRQSDTPTPDELAWFARGLASGAVSDAQAGAFAMAVCLNRLSTAGRVALTEGMRDSGDTLQWDLGKPVLDKHSTGGIGDCVSLILAPVLAACDVAVPMISGRGLGHTGGTLDKLEAIPGVTTQVSAEHFRDMVADIGCAIIGATGEVAPADKRLYAIRDVTATVESVDLITASILSKKLAAGLDGLVLDVKTGSGAFMQTVDEALVLAKALVETANGAGCKTTALVTDMNSPLAPALGNATELSVCLEVLAGNVTAAPKLYELTVALATELLVLTGEEATVAQARAAAAITSGHAMERFARMISAMGGPNDIERARSVLPTSAVRREVLAAENGVISAMDGVALGNIVVDLGGGRRVETDQIDPSVGLSQVASVGDAVQEGDLLCIIHAADDASAEVAAGRVQTAMQIGDDAPTHPLLIERLTS